MRDDATPAPKKIGKRAVSLLTILIATTLVAIAAAPVPWLGTNYAIGAAFSLLLLAIVGSVLALKQTLVACLVCVLAVVPAALLFSSGLFYQAVGTLVVCFVTIGVPSRVSLRTGLCVAIMLIAYVPTLQYARSSDLRVDRMREAYPLVSLRPRLPASADGRLRPLSLSKEQNIAMALVDADSDANRSTWYSYQLERLHSDSYKAFARSPGFGFLRMGPVTEHRLVDAEEELLGEPITIPTQLPAAADNATPASLHHRSQLAFLDRNRFGFVQDLDQVAGFQGHGFSRTPYGDDSERLEKPSGAWTLHRLDLIGLLLHKEPVAYVSNELPSMEELGETPTRELNHFEVVALDQLREEEDLVIDEKTEAGTRRVAMVGAIRAGKNCQTCHEVAYGTLLGAFSYDLTRLAGEP